MRAVTPRGMAGRNSNAPSYRFNDRQTEAAALRIEPWYLNLPVHTG